MTNRGVEEDPVWRQCELRWAEWLIERDYHVEPLADAEGNVAETRAPMVRSRTGNTRAPDILTVSPDGLTEFWEVKYRCRPDLDPSTGQPCYWVSDAAFSDYLLIADRAPLWVVLYEAPNAHHDGRWLQASADDIKAAGVRETKHGRGGQSLLAWTWPAETMTIVEGPRIGKPEANEPIVPNEGDGAWVTNEELLAADRLQGSESSSGEPAQGAVQDQPAKTLVGKHARLGLQATSVALGLPSLPQYSVTRVGGLTDASAREVRSLIEHGIRVFWLTPAKDTTVLTDARAQSWKAARLLEVADLPDDYSYEAWIVDGQIEPDDQDARDALVTADELSGFNLGQYQIVHSPPDEHISVLAGAGTGKTETMTERSVFLLATSDSRGIVGESHPGSLKASELAFVTFTREAAAQMRARLSRTLLLRQRLCSRPSQPFRQWASELTATKITTLHSFAQSLITEHGAAAGYGKDLIVSQQLLAFRRLTQSALSTHLSDAYESWAEAPAEYEWQKHIDAVWVALENKAPLMSLYGTTEEPVDLGEPHGDAHQTRVVTATNEVLRHLSASFGEFCREEGTIPTSQLIPLALAILREIPDGQVAGLRHLFVDEFQDTDAQQIALMMQVLRSTACTMFYVGDTKQGIYRFRGAAGDAFTQTERALAVVGCQPLSLALSKNFRSSPTLLSSMDPLFEAWDRVGLLDYGETLRAARQRTDGQLPVIPRSGSLWEGAQAQVAADRVAAWRTAEPDAEIGILCRDNRQTHLMKQALATRAVGCVTYTGGEFYRTPAVLEFRSLLEAVADPLNDAAALELMQTSWGQGIATPEPPAMLQLTEGEQVEWKTSQVGLADWPTRVGEFSAGQFDRTDLESLRSRLALLSALTRRTSTLNLITSMTAAFAPAGLIRRQGGSSEGPRYRRCLNHLVTLLVDGFDGGSATLPSMLDWLRLKIATDRAEDEPVDPELVQGDGTCVALTVHKAKGLEYERVIIPFTGGRFLRPTREGKTSASVVDSDGAVQLLWEWHPRGSSTVFRNHARSDSAVAIDRREQIREEARLLYVAMTRAKDELVVLTGDPSGADITAWNDLLRLGWNS